MTSFVTSCVAAGEDGGAPVVAPGNTVIVAGVEERGFPALSTAVIPTLAVALPRFADLLRICLFAPVATEGVYIATFGGSAGGLALDQPTLNRHTIAPNADRPISIHDFRRFFMIFSLWVGQDVRLEANHRLRFSCPLRPSYVGGTSHASKNRITSSSEKSA